MLDLMYSIPTWALGILIVSLVTAASLAGLVLVHRRVPVAVRAAHNDVAGFISAMVGVIYAVLLAFIAIAVWEAFDKAESTVVQEANSVSDLYRSARGYPEALQRRIRDGMGEYVRVVIEGEWKPQSHGTVSERAWNSLEAVHKEMLDFEPRTPKEQVVHAEGLKLMDNVLDARRQRLYLGESGLQPVVWAVLLVGSALTIGFTFFFGSENFRAHMAMTGAVAISIGLLLFLIVALDYPFRGTVSIPPEAFERVLENFKRLAAHNA